MDADSGRRRKGFRGERENDSGVKLRSSKSPIMRRNGSGASTCDRDVTGPWRHFVRRNRAGMSPERTGLAFEPEVGDARITERHYNAPITY